MVQKIVLAAGCFWGTQAYFDLQKGIVTTRVGYANGNKEETNYYEVCQGKTNFVEACEITFDDKIISIKSLLDKYWSIVDPTLLNRQGHDFGTQYRTGIYYDRNFSDDMIKQLEMSKQEISKQYQKPIVTEILPLKNFVEAEPEQQKYLEKHPGGYCHINLGK